ncbi:MAG: CBS domain-containing protein, partial [Synechococcales cyanobacterium M58_A2018_015]|nr:CBS domain-containing protein [Synechococcales cyanobacterium M58_A2018_015]
MTRQFRVVDAEQTLHQFATTYLADESATDVYYAASDGRYRGLVAVEELQSIERSLWEMEPLSQIIHPLTEIPAVTETTPLTEVIEQLETTNLRRLTVLSPAGAVAGVIDRGDVVRALAEKLRVPIPEPVIKRIKEEGKFPPELQLQAIAKAAKE